MCALRGALALSDKTSAPLFADNTPDQIGPYQLRQKLGEGGCGIVYLAEQSAPLRRQVALKIVKLGMDTRQVIARFENERHALALMEHQNIARVLDADRGARTELAEWLAGKYGSTVSRWKVQLAKILNGPQIPDGEFVLAVDAWKSARIAKTTSHGRSIT